jgi:hypothetical protein
MGYSAEVNPWSQHLDGTPNAALPKEASAYSGLHQHKHHRHHHHPKSSRDIAESHIDPWVYDKVEPNVEWAPLRRPNDEPEVDRYWEPVETKALT